MQKNLGSTIMTKQESTRSIPSFKLYFPQEDITQFQNYSADILESGMLTLGKYTRQFEEQCSKILGTPHSIAVNSGTSAIEIALRSLRIADGEIVVPTNSFGATAAAPILSGNKVRFADIEERTLCASRSTIEEQLTRTTKAVVLVHIAGIISPEVDQIRILCEEKGISLIEDAAHAFGSRFQGKSAGNFGVVGCFSFYPTKVVSAGEGGLVVTSQAELDRNARVLRDQGKESFNSNIIVDLGYNWRMSEFNAAAGLIASKRINEIVEKRNHIASIYNEILRKSNLVSVVETPDGCLNNYYKYVILLASGINRDEFKMAMKSQKSIACSGEVYTPPLHLEPIFMKLLGTKRGDYPIAEDVCQRMVCLPMYQEIDDDAAGYVAASAQEVAESLH